MNRLFAGRVLGVLSQLAGIGLLLTSAWLIVRAAEQPPVLYLMVAIVSVRFFGLARALLRYAERLLTHDAAFALVTEARVEVYRELDRVAPVGMSSRRRGDLVSRVVSDVDAVQDRVLRLRGPWVISLAASAIVILLVAILDPRSAVVLAMMTIATMLLVRVVVPWSVRRSGELSAHWRGELAAEVSQAVLASPDLVAHGATAILGDKAHLASARLAEGQRRAAVFAGLGQAIVLGSGGIAVAVIAALSGGLPPVVVGVVVLAPLSLLDPLDALADAERLRPAIEDAERRLAELAGVPTPVVVPAHTAAAPVHSDLAVEGLSIGWSTPLATDISFTVPEGAAVGIGGPSGSGKSTLALTLLRLVEPHGGTVRLGGVDVRALEPADVRTRIGYLGQDEVVFDTTIRENLRIADPDASDDAMVAALDQAGLGLLLASLPRGLDTRVGERGSKLSGGERQRLCLGRLLLGGHRLLIVDEPTEHLDQDAADQLIEDLLSLCPDRSLLVISHSDRVLNRLDAVVSLTSDGHRTHRIAV